MKMKISQIFKNVDTTVGILASTFISFGAIGLTYIGIDYMHSTYNTEYNVFLIILLCMYFISSHCLRIKKKEQKKLNDEFKQVSEVLKDIEENYKR